MEYLPLNTISLTLFDALLYGVVHPWNTREAEDTRYYCTTSLRH